MRPKLETEVQLSANLSPVLVDRDNVQSSLNVPEVELNLEPDTQPHTFEKAEKEVQHKQRLDNAAKRHVGVKRQFRQETQPEVKYFDGHKLMKGLIIVQTSTCTFMHQGRSAISTLATAA